MPIILGLAASYVEPIIRSFRAAVNDQKTLLAKSVADSMFEIALWDSRGSGTGETTHNAGYPAPLEVDYGFGTAQITWSVIGSPEVDAEHLISDGSAEFYTVPSAGSGDAGGDYCSTAEPVIDQVTLENRLINDLLITSQPIDDPLDWPCHWNKIGEGETVIIPLYVEEEGVIKNPGFSWNGTSIGSDNINLNSMEVRFRNPCDPNVSDLGYEICRNTMGDRFIMKNFKPDNEFTTIVLWNITGEGENENNTLVEKSVLIEPYNKMDFGAINNITVEDINGFFTKDNDYWITLDRLVNYQGGNPNLLNNYLPNIHKPVLNLLVVHTLRDAGNATIPYIEYQFKAPEPLSGKSPISSTSKVVRVDVMIDGGYSETLERTISLPKPISGFVIQQ
ncbi:hypothetical protein ACFLZH_03255 [Patescibacteria group bacterium]